MSSLSTDTEVYSQPFQTFGASWQTIKWLTAVNIFSKKLHLR